MSNFKKARVACEVVAGSGFLLFLTALVAAASNGL